LRHSPSAVAAAGCEIERGGEEGAAAPQEAPSRGPRKRSHIAGGAAAVAAAGGRPKRKKSRRDRYGSDGDVSEDEPWVEEQLPGYSEEDDGEAEASSSDSSDARPR